MNKLAAAAEAMRQWARAEIKSGRTTTDVHAELCNALDAVETEVRVEFVIPDVTYYEVYAEDNARIGFTSLRPGERVPQNFKRCVDQEPRYEFLARQGLSFGYKDRL